MNPNTSAGGLPADMPTLGELGWSPRLEVQVTPGEAALVPARVVAVHRSGPEVLGPAIDGRVFPLRRSVDGEAPDIAVGDWLLVDPQTRVTERVLDRATLFRRKAAGDVQRFQVIAANVDTLFIVSSCNADFNVPRLERYLALAREAEVNPVVVLTKADQADDAAAFVRAASRLMPGLLVECLDARDPAEVRCLRPWCGMGQTVALVGSSGVGKSTLVNTLRGDAGQATQGIREDDARGRHTTTTRSLLRLPDGGWLLDTPGMRELQLADAGQGIADVFADIVAVAAGCRFSDCTHDGEPGCAVVAAIERGEIEPERLARFHKLVREDTRNSEAIWTRRQRERSFGRLTRSASRAREDRRGGE